MYESEDSWSEYNEPKKDPWQFDFDQEFKIMHKKRPTKAIMVGRFIASNGHRFYVIEFIDCVSRMTVFLVRTASKLRKMIIL